MTNFTHFQVIIVSSCTCIKGNPHDVMTIWLPGFHICGKIDIFWLWGGQFLSKFDTVISKTSLWRYGGIGKEKFINFAHFQIIITCTKGFSQWHHGQYGQQFYRCTKSPFFGSMGGHFYSKLDTVIFLRHLSMKVCWYSQGRVNQFL